MNKIKNAKKKKKKKKKQKEKKQKEKEKKERRKNAELGIYLRAGTLLSIRYFWWLAHACFARPQIRPGFFDISLRRMEYFYDGVLARARFTWARLMDLNKSRKSELGTRKSEVEGEGGGGGAGGG